MEVACYPRGRANGMASSESVPCIGFDPAGSILGGSNGGEGKHESLCRDGRAESL